MAGTRFVHTATLVDSDSGAFVGMSGADGKEYPLNQPALQALVAGNRVLEATSRAITAADNGRLLAPTVSLTYTIPAGLSPAPSFSVDVPLGGTVTVAVSGGATVNGASTSLTRSRAANVVGFVVVAHNETDSYGVSGA